MFKVFAYEIGPIDIAFGTWDLAGLPMSRMVEAESLARIFTSLYPDEVYRDSPRFGFMPVPGSPNTEVWAFRKLDNNGTTVVVSPVPMDFGTLSDAYQIDMSPHKSHGVFQT